MKTRETSPFKPSRGLAAITAGLLLYACSSTEDAGQREPTFVSRQPQPGATAAKSSLPVAPARRQASPPPVTVRPEPDSAVIDARPAALINGRPVTWSELRPALTELAGAEALNDLILDRMIDKQLAAAGLTITPDDIAGERKLLLENMHDDPNTAVRLLNELRDRQKLGPVRFEALLRRNAGMRALVRPQVSVNEESIRRMYEMTHGPRRQARIIVVNDLSAAQAAINLVKDGGNFADVAVEVSNDSSAPRGGLLEPIAQADPNYPEALRQTLWSLSPGEISGPVLVDDKYVVVLLVKRVPGTGIPMDSIRAGLERLVRINQERLLMDQLARRVLSEAAVTVLDAQLHEASQRRTRAVTR